MANLVVRGLLGGLLVTGDLTPEYTPINQTKLVVGGLLGGPLVTRGLTQSAIIGVGGYRHGGMAAATRAATASASGGVDIGGAATHSQSTVTINAKVVTGGMLSNALVTRGLLGYGVNYQDAASGGMRFGTVKTLVAAYVAYPEGGLRVGGTPPVNFPSLFNAVGGSRFGGTSAVTAPRSVVGSGGMAVGGKILIGVPAFSPVAPRVVISMGAI